MQKNIISLATVVTEIGDTFKYVGYSLYKQRSNTKLVGAIVFEAFHGTLLFSCN